MENIGERTAKKGRRVKGVRGFKGEITKEDGAEKRRGRGFTSPSPLFPPSHQGGGVEREGIKRAGMEEQKTGTKGEKKWEGKRERKNNDTGKRGEQKGR